MIVIHLVDVHTNLNLVALGFLLDGGVFGFAFDCDSSIFLLVFLILTKSVDGI